MFKIKGCDALHVIWIKSFIKFMYVRAHVPVSQVTVIIQYLENLTSELTFEYRWNTERRPFSKVYMEDDGSNPCRVC